MGEDMVTKHVFSKSGQQRYPNRRRCARIKSNYQAVVRVGEYSAVEATILDWSPYGFKIQLGSGYVDGACYAETPAAAVGEGETILVEIRHQKYVMEVKWTKGNILGAEHEWAYTAEYTDDSPETPIYRVSAVAACG
jgi:hypothetical protein